MVAEIPFVETLKCCSKETNRNTDDSWDIIAIVAKFLKALQKTYQTDQSVFVIYRHFETQFPLYDAGIPIFYDYSRKNLPVLQNINLRSTVSRTKHSTRPITIINIAVFRNCGRRILKKY